MNFDNKDSRLLKNLLQMDLHANTFNQNPLNNSEGLIIIVTTNDEDLADILCAFLNPVGAHGYCFAYSGDAQKLLRGHTLFYETGLGGCWRSNGFHS